MAEGKIICSVRDGIATVILNSPPLNLVTLELTAELDAVLDALAIDSSVRVLILTGAGKRAFCAGSDIREMRGMQEPGAILHEKLIGENATYTKLDRSPKPTIACVQGLALGGGPELAVCCDLIVAEEGAKLGLPEIKLGWFPGSGGTVRVTRRVGEGRAKELMFLGEPIESEIALRWGLINWVAPKGDALEAATRIAQSLSERANIALQLCKRAIDLSFDVGEDEAIAGSLSLSGEVFATQDTKEGMRAFFAKDEPAFSHR